MFFSKPNKGVKYISSSRKFQYLIHFIDYTNPSSFGKLIDKNYNVFSKKTITSLILKLVKPFH